MKKLLVSILSASLLSTGILPLEVKAEEVNTEDKVTVAYSKTEILEKIKNNEPNTNIILDYKPGKVELPPNYNYSVVQNPETNKSYIKVKSEISTRGLKKTIIVNAFRYGGKYLGEVLEIVSDDAAKYVTKNSGLIAKGIDNASAMIHGEILQSLINVGVPLKYARNIAWAIDVVFL